MGLAYARSVRVLLVVVLSIVAVGSKAQLVAFYRGDDGDLPKAPNHYKVQVFRAPPKWWEPVLFSYKVSDELSVFDRSQYRLRNDILLGKEVRVWLSKIETDFEKQAWIGATLNLAIQIQLPQGLGPEDIIALNPDRFSRAEIQSQSMG